MRVIPSAKMVKTAPNFNYSFLFVIFLSTVSCQGDIGIQDENYTAANETSYKYYSLGVDRGIINPAKYTFQSFLRDKQNIFNELYRDYATNHTQHLNFKEWLLFNNFGILPDTQESLFAPKLVKRSTANSKRRFVKIVRKGDILITGRGVGGLIGHSAIMITDNYVLEMPGGKGWNKGIPDNNRRITKDQWFDEHKTDCTIVYRCPDRNAARDAAVWAHHTYYNSRGGEKKRKHIRYYISPDVWSTDPSYCSKLVIQAYYFGTGKREVINDKMMTLARVIVPIKIPNYFLSKFKLLNIGKY